MIPASSTGGIHALIGMIQSVQSPEAEPQPRRQPGITDADLADLSALAWQRQQARDVLAANQAAPASSNIEQFTVEAIAGGAPVTRRQRPGSSLGINA
ncbi:TPA: hypothetical protein QDZ23_005869 [Pseudomonas putida]|nr:hypothetical protein [Pseudomonas putida]